MAAANATKESSTNLGTLNKFAQPWILNVPRSISALENHNRMQEIKIPNTHF